MASEAAGSVRRVSSGPSPTVSAEGEVVCVEIPVGYDAPYGEYVRFLRHQLPGIWLDWVAAREAYRFGRGRPFPIGRRRSEAASDEKAKVRASEDGLAAYLILYPPKPHGKRLTETELLQVIRGYGVPPGLLDTQHVRLAFLRRTYGEPERIAQGLAPVDGASAKIEWLQGIPTDPDGFLTALHDGDGPYPSSLLVPVVADQRVGTLRPAEDGNPGLSVAGAPLASRKGSNPTRLGAGLELLPATNEIRSCREGQLRIGGVGGTHARVFPLLTVKNAQELEPWAGGIFPGSLIVEGDLEVRFPLRVVGDVEVRGGLVRSGVEVMGSLFVRDGVINHTHTPVRVGGVLSASFFDRASVMAHTVYLRRYALQSRIVAAHTIVASGTDVSVAGGHASALQHISVAALGSSGSMETEVAVGLPGTGAAFHALYRGWAEGLSQAVGLTDEDSRELEEAAHFWRAAAEEPPALDLATARIEARKVYSGVSVRIAGAGRDIGNACGPVCFGYEKIGDRDRVAMTRR